MDLTLSDNEGQAGKSVKLPPAWPKHPNDEAANGFVTSIKGIFRTQHHKEKAFVHKTKKGEVENETQGDFSEYDGEIAPFARHLTNTQAKKIIRKHTKKLQSKAQKGLL